MDLVPIIVLAYFLIGSSSLGYFFLRNGWPRIRMLGEKYKAGWSMLLGLLFTFLVGVVALVQQALGFMGMGFSKIFALDLAAAMAAIFLLLSIRRKYIASKKVTVSIPKEFASASIAAERATEKIFSDDSIFEKPDEEKQKMLQQIKKDIAREKEQGE